MKWRFLLCSLFLVTISLAALADTLVVAGHARKIVLLTPAKDEVLAPILPSLPQLGIKAFRRENTVSLVKPDGTTCKLQVGSHTAVVGKRTVPLPVPLREVRTVLYLPVMALAPLLDLDARFDEEQRALSLLPLLKVSYQSRPEGLAILARSTVPLRCSRGTLNYPPRMYFDFQPVSLGLEEQQIPAGHKPIKRLRLLQRSPTSVRLVIDLERATLLKTAATEQGRLVTISSGQAAETETVQLLTAVLQPRPGKQSEIAIATSDTADVESRYQRQSRTLTLLFPDCDSTIPARQLRALHDARITKAAVYDLPDGTGVKMVITLKPHLAFDLRKDKRHIRVRIGAFDLHGMIIVLDAGHGGIRDDEHGVKGDPGACGVNGVFEKDVNLGVVLRTAKLLQSTGAKVILTRADDTFVELDDRVALANEKKADIFIAVHCNSGTDSVTASGTETYYFTAQSATLAAAIHPALASELGLPDRGIRSDQGYEVIKYTHMPSVLVELGFLCNPDEEALLKSTTFQQKAAEALVDGIRAYAANHNWRARGATSTVSDTDDEASGDEEQ